MRKILLTGWCLVGILAGISGLFTIAPATADTGSLLARYAPKDAAARSVAVFLVPFDGWTPALQERAARLSGMHTLVIALEAGDACAEATQEILSIVTRARDAAGALPRAPVLVGFGAAAGLAHAIAATAPTQIKGLVTETGADADLTCPLAPAPSGKAPVRWHLVHNGADALGEGVAGTKLYAPTPSRPDPFYQAYLALAGMDHAFDTGTIPPELQSFPLTLHRPSSGRMGESYAIFLSGDGGWARFDEEIADRLAAAGIPVVGVSSLKYLWAEKPPDVIAADIARLDAYFRAALGRERLLLIGFSMGANVMPFAIPHLNAQLRDRLAGTVLVSPEERTGFEIIIGGWLGRETGTHSVVNAIDALRDVVPGDRVICLHGVKDKVSACPHATLPDLQIAAFDGGHHMDNAYDALAARIIAGIDPAGSVDRHPGLVEEPHALRVER